MIDLLIGLGLGVLAYLCLRLLVDGAGKSTIEHVTDKKKERFIYVRRGGDWWI